MLLVDHHGGKAVAGDQLGNQRIGQAAPGGKDGFAGAQAAGQGEGLQHRHRTAPPGAMSSVVTGRF
jgi:hypothetical protein